MADGRDAQVTPGPGSDAFRGASRLERVVLPYLREPTLWPVFAVVVAHVLLVVSPLLVLAARDRHASAITALVVLGGVSAAGLRQEMRTRGRPGLLAGLIVSVWAVCAAGAWACVRFGWV